MCTKLSSWSISNTRFPEPVASGATAESDFGASPRSAWNSAAALVWHSRSSSSGLLSNKQVAPTRTSARPSFMRMVRMVRPVLIEPSKPTTAERAGVPAPRRAFIVLDELDRPVLRRAGHRHRPCVGEERIERIEAGPQNALDMIDGVKQLRIGLDLPPRENFDRSRHADARLVVAIDVGAHVELELVLLRVQQFADLFGVADGISAARDGPGNRAGLDPAAILRTNISGDAETRNSPSPRLTNPP